MWVRRWFWFAVVCLLAAESRASETAAELITEAKLAAKSGDALRADALLQKAEPMEPGEALMLRGNVAGYLQKDMVKAIELYRSSIAADATRWDANYFLGRALAGQQRWNEAADAFSAAYQLNPSHPSVLIELGQTQAKVDNGFSAATGTLLKAAAIDVHDTQPLLLLAQTALHLGHVDVGLAAYADVSEVSAMRPSTLVAALPPPDPTQPLVRARTPHHSDLTPTPMPPLAVTDVARSADDAAGEPAVSARAGRLVVGRQPRGGASAGGRGHGASRRAHTVRAP